MKAWRLLAIVVVAIGGVAAMLPASTSLVFAEQDVSDVRLLDVAQDQAGRLWAAWEADVGTDAEIFFSYQLHDEWTPPQLVHSRPHAWDRAPSLVIDTTGTPWLAWSSAERTDPGHSSIYVSRWNSGRWSTAEQVPLGSMSLANCAECGEADEPELAAAPDGTLWLAWVGFDGTDDEVFAQQWDGDSWLLPLRVSADDDDPVLYDRQPRLAVGVDLRPWLVWTGYEGGLDDEVFASRWTGDTWSQEQMINADDELLDTNPTVALDAQGQPWVLWQSHTLDEANAADWLAAVGEGGGRMRILMSRWDDSTSTWIPETLASSSPAFEGDESDPILALDDQGQMRAAWRATSGASTAYAHARWAGGAWTEPRLAYDGAPYERAAFAVTGDGVPTLLWADAMSAEPLPLEWVAVEEKASPLLSWVPEKAPMEGALKVDPYPNHYLARGDSITWGEYDGNTPYPTLMETQLDASIADSYVVNRGVSGAEVEDGMEHMVQDVTKYRPKYVVFMMGTNDVTHHTTPAEVKGQLVITRLHVRNHPIVNDVWIMFATIIPRLDDLNDETIAMNEQAIKPISDKAPVCDQYRNFQEYPGSLSSLYRDHIHPNQTGLQLLANEFHDCILEDFFGIPPDQVPPVVLVNDLPPTSECGQVSVSWTGADASGMADYDVQAKVGDGVWTDWLLGTTATNAIYPGGAHNDELHFRARGRDTRGNESTYSASKSTMVIDSRPPDASGILSLLPAQAAPFDVGWWGTDACSAVTAFDVQYKVGAGGWQDWLTGSLDASGTFSPTVPAYGQVYQFQVKAEDELGNKQAEWSDPVSTTLARFRLSGSVLTNREDPAALTTVSVQPAPLYFKQYQETFDAFAVDAGDYSLSVAPETLSAQLPPMHLTAVSETMTGLDFFLPPDDDLMLGGGFEIDLSGWEAEGNLPPALTVEAHTGIGGVQLGDQAMWSRLSQVVTPSVVLNDATLSFMVRLAEGGADSTLELTVAAGQPPVPAFSLGDLLTVENESWTHVWYDLTGVMTDPITITFVVSDNASVVLDEVSLGSVGGAGTWLYLPLISKQ